MIITQPLTADLENDGDQNEVEKWLSDIVSSMKGSLPVDKINIVKQLLEHDGIFERSDILLISEKLTMGSLKSIGVPAAFANRIEAAVGLLSVPRPNETQAAKEFSDSDSPISSSDTRLGLDIPMRQHAVSSSGETSIVDCQYIYQVRE